ncbi:MAG: hypothetical protein PF694_06675 [Bacteroidetes bacterium]|jgi:hypothetical protein|nr:hypothetical protein [Bacteroidota bacterium]
MKIFLISLSFFLLTTHNQIDAQSFTEIKDVDILADSRIVLEKVNPSVFDTLVVKDVMELNDKHSKVIYEDEGIYCEVIVNSHRKDMLLIATAIEKPQDQIPEIVMEAFKQSEFSSWQIEKTLAMKTPYDSWFYAFDISKNNKNERLFYDELGAYKSPPY